MREKVRRVMAVFLCAVLMVGTISLHPQAAVPSVGVSVEVEGTLQEAQAREVLKLINEARAEVGVDPLIMELGLEETAKQRAAELTVLMEHRRPDGTDCWTATDGLGYPYRSIGENIAQGFLDAASVVEAWMNSEGHRANILNADFSHIGIGCFEYDGVWYWVQLFMGGLTDMPEAPGQGADGVEWTAQVLVSPDVVAGQPMFLEPDVTVGPGTEIDCDLTVDFGKGAMPVSDPGAILESSDDAVAISGTKIQVTAGAVGTVTLTATVGDNKAVKNLTVICDHAWGEWQTAEEATWDKDGVKVRQCAICQAEERETIPSLSVGHEHDFSGEATVEKEASCEAAGSRIIACADPNCAQTITEEIPALGHDKKETVVSATCTEEGWREVTCSRCGAVLEREDWKAAGHVWGGWTVTKEAAWDMDGEQIRTCETCQAQETQIIPKRMEGHEHDFTGKETIVEATCTDDGSRTVNCSDPDCAQTQVTVIPALGHEGKESITPAGCETDGKRDVICSRCEVLLDTEVLPAVGHAWGEWKTTKEATCTEDGSKTAVCENESCTAEKTEVIKALGHEEKEVEKEPTCTEKGEKELICSHCDLSLKKEVIPAMGHKYGEWKTVREATEKEAGERQRVCEVCKNVEKEKLVAPKDAAKTGDDGLAIFFTISLVSAAVVLVLVGCIVIDRKRKANRR